MTDSKDDATAAVWDARYREGKLACTQRRVDADPVDYTQHPFLYRHAVARRLTGQLDANPMDPIAQRFLVPAAGEMLSIGAGLAFVEQWFVECGYVDRIVAFESSAVAVATATDRLTRQGLGARIELHAEDVLKAALEPGRFDVVFVQAAIHHFFEIEQMFARMYSLLKPGGLLIYDEYVGPDHHMYDSDTMDLLDRVNECLAPAYRYDVLRGEVRTRVPRPSMEWMLNMDPSEGVHASRILPLTYRYFDVEYRGDYGGALMRPFFAGILPNFDFDDPKDQTVARLIVLVEDLLTGAGTLPHYHTVVVGRRRPAPRPDLTAEESRRINYTGWSPSADAGASVSSRADHE